MDQDYYAVLGVEWTAEIKEISKAYRAQALKHHPDKSSLSESPAMFLLVNKAYQVLSDVEARTAYDDLRRVRLSRLERDKAMAGKRAEFREDLFRREAAELQRQRDAEAEAAARLDLALARLRKGEGEGSIRQRTCRFKWRSLRPLHPDFIRAKLGPESIESIDVNKMRTGAEVIFFTRELALAAAALPHDPDGKFDYLGNDEVQSESVDVVEIEVPFEDYERATLARLRSQ